MIETILATATVNDTGLKEYLAALGVIATALFTFLGTRFLAQKKQESSRDAALDSEISKLRGLTWQHLEGLQNQISGLKEELESEKDYTDQLRDHIYDELPPPPPKRRKSNSPVTNVIDLSQDQAESSTV